jgi:hypothetical protein
MTIQQAIEKAIEGGLREGEKWKFVSANRYWAVWLDGNGTETTIAMEMYFMSPLFWQSLGKAMGWEEELVIENYDTIAYQYWKGRPQWVFEWHRFIEYLVEGKDAESFFKNL